MQDNAIKEKNEKIKNVGLNERAGIFGFGVKIFPLLIKFIFLNFVITSKKDELLIDNLR